MKNMEFPCAICGKKPITSMMRVYGYGSCIDCFPKCGKCKHKMTFVAFCNRCMRFHYVHPKEKKEKIK